MSLGDISQTHFLLDVQNHTRKEQWQLYLPRLADGVLTFSGLFGVKKKRVKAGVWGEAGQARRVGAWGMLAGWVGILLALEPNDTW